MTLYDLTSYNGLSKLSLPIYLMNEPDILQLIFHTVKNTKACFYLDFTDMAVSEIAEKIGYNDQYYFSRLFKR